MAVPYLPTNFNPSTPQGANSVTQMVMEQVWPQAFVVDPQFEAETQGFIDSAEVISLNPMTVSYAIDPAAEWSDGYPITAADFIYNWRQILLQGPNLASVGVLAGYRDIRSISGSDNGKTVTVSFNTPYSDWESLFANLIPAHIARRAGWVAAFEGFHPADVISGGPFVVSSVEPHKRLVLSRNAKYWGTPAHLQSIVFQVEPTQKSALAALKAGSVAIAALTPGPGLESTIARDDAEGADLEITTTSSPQLWQLVFNLDDSLLTNPLMRTALTLITNRGQLVADSVDLESPATTTADSRIFAQGQPGSGAETASPFGYNPSEGALVFKSLGFLPDEDGVLRDNGVGVPLTFTITGPKDNVVIEHVEQQLQAQWAACGVTLLIRNVPLRYLLDDVLPRGDYELAVAPYLLPVFPTWDAIDYTQPYTSDPVLPWGLALHSGSLPFGGAPPEADTFVWSVATEPGTEPGAAELGAVTRDVTGMYSPAVAKQFQAVMEELNTDNEIQLLARLDAMLTRRLPTLPLFQTPISLVQREDIVNVSESPDAAGPLWDAEDWVIEVTRPVAS